jgi:hypothetical protein
MPYPSLSKHVAEAIVGDRLDEDLTTEEIVAEAQKSFIPFFLIPDHARAKRCERRWRDLLGDHVLVLESAMDVCSVAAGAILLSEGRAATMDELASLLLSAGMPAGRKSQVLQALTPFADVVGLSTRNPGWLSRWFQS